MTGNDIYIATHQGLGDHCLFNGLIRYACNKLKPRRICIFSKAVYFNSLVYVFSDDKNINVIRIPENADDVTYITNIIKNNTRILTGIWHPTGINSLLHPSKTYDEICYEQAGIPYTARWNSFYINRDLNKEEETFNKFNLKNKDYIFVHDSPERNLILNVNSKYNIVKFDLAKEENMFTYIKILQQAKEIHCIDSSFRCLVDHIETKNNLHFYMNSKLFKGPIPKSKRDWIIHNE